MGFRRCGFETAYQRGRALAREDALTLAADAVPKADAVADPIPAG